jgi:hypothetical protein
MMELNSESLAQLVSLGGWLRGTEALAMVVNKGFSKDGAELMHQPVLVEHFNLQLQGLPEKASKEPVIAKIQNGLTLIKPLMGTEDGTGITEKDARQIGKICAELVAAVNSKTGK